VRKKYRTVRFLKSNNGTDNGTKTVPRYCPPLLIEKQHKHSEENDSWIFKTNLITR